MAQRRTTRTPAKKVEEVELPDQTPDEAEDAAAQMAEHEFEANGNKYPDQTVGDAQLAEAIAEDSDDWKPVEDDVEASAKSDEKVEVEKAKNTKKDAPSEDQNMVEIVESGFMVGGRLLSAGQVVSVPDSVYNEDQEAVYGRVFFRKI